MNAQTLSDAPGSRWSQFYALTKPRVVQLIVFCALIGMVLAVPGVPTLTQLGDMAIACFGIWLVSAAAAAFNCLVERHIDARMKRTSWRPTAKGELTPQQALAFSAILCTVGAAILLAFTNPLTMWLTLATFIGYAVIYTVILKPATPQNIVIGGASGAMPPVLGLGAVPHHLPVDAAPLLGAGAVSRRGLQEVRPAHAARDPWPQVHPDADPALHPGAVCRLSAACDLWHERLAVSDRGLRAVPGIQLVCAAPVDELLRRAGPQDLPLLADPPERCICRAAD